MSIPHDIALTPITYHDLEVDQYVVFYEEYPHAIAVGQTEECACNKLVDMIELTWFQNKQKSA